MRTAAHDDGAASSEGVRPAMRDCEYGDYFRKSLRLSCVMRVKGSV